MNRKQFSGCQGLETVERGPFRASLGDGTALYGAGMVDMWLYAAMKHIELYVENSDFYCKQCFLKYLSTKMSGEH